MKKSKKTKINCFKCFCFPERKKKQVKLNRMGVFNVSSKLKKSTNWGKRQKNFNNWEFILKNSLKLRKRKLKKYKNKKKILKKLSWNDRKTWSRNLEANWMHPLIKKYFLSKPKESKKSSRLMHYTIKKKTLLFQEKIISPCTQTTNILKKVLLWANS